MKKLEFLIVREGETTQAVVSLDSVDLSLSNDEAMQKICDCVAAWIDNTQEGQEAWDDSGEDFNIGDLSGYINDHKLKAQLSLSGLFNLQVMANEVEPLDTFTYDTVLPRRAATFKG